MMNVEEQRKLAWHDRLEYCLSDYKRIDADIRRARKDFEDFVHLKEIEKEAIDSKFSFVKGILTAGDEVDDDPDKGLLANSTAALEFIGFEVSAIGDKVRSTIKTDACWVQDGDYLSLVDVVATTAENVTLREYSRFLGRIALMLRHPEITPGGIAPTGVLIVNHDRMTNPFDRSRLYAGSDEEILTDAVDQGVGLLSTVELYKLVLAVEKKILSEVDAREFVKQPGRITFNLEESPGTSPAQPVQPAHIVLDGRVLAL